ncbi:MAG: GNAT family N-acetyltransferase [Candidatus Dormibacteraeota bacterium]|nr:GNAT family N-acetyltransferase [Candidatus Dormibacteraeota bacterium]MBO0745086.1 GNAT family N-acetyltransferase [Candidatus Dormibacteraeota bacterium]
MSLQLRAVGIAEARLAADLETRARPQEPVDPPTLKHRLLHPAEEGPHHLHVVTDGAAPVGIADFQHPEGAAWEPERVSTLNLALVPEAAARAPEVLRRLEALAGVDHPKQLRGWSLDSERYLNEAFAAAGYEHVRSGVAQDLDLVSGRERLLAMREQTRARMSEQGIALRHGGQLPEDVLLEQAIAVFNRTLQDMPHSVEEPEMDDAAMRAYTSSPSFHLDRFWTAWDGDRLVALSFLDFPVERGHVWTGYTACERAYRGRGIAQAVKDESVGQAVELGIPRVRTDNDAQNQPMLAINRKLGYVPVYSIWEWLKRAR